jgi:hypothetical protein
MMLLAHAMQQGGTDSAGIKAALPMAAKGYAGATGKIVGHLHPTPPIGANR